MAGVKKTAKRKIDHDPVVSAVLGNRHEPVGDVICIGGFVGESPRADHIRLFTKIDFSECLDIPEDKIVGVQKVQKVGIPDGTYVWVKRSAVIGLTVIDPVVGQSAFLQGAILRSNPTIAKRMRARGAQAGIISTPICSIVVITVVTFTLVVCTRVDCPDPTDDCPEPPEPEPPNTTIID
jgi:hypothetical protein